MAANKIVLQVLFDEGGAQKQIDAINQQLAKMGQSGIKAGEDASKGLKGFSVTVEQTSQAIKNLAVSLAGLSVGAIIRDWLKLGDTMARTGFVLRGIVGDQAATKLEKQIFALAQYAGASIETVEHMVSKLVGTFGVSAERAATLTKLFLDVSAQKTGGLENAMGLIDMIGKASLRGAITVKELNQGLLMLGIAGGPIIQKALGVGRQELSKMLKGDQDVTVPLGLLFNEMQKAGGAAKALADSLPSAQFQRFLNIVRAEGQETFKAWTPTILAVLQALQGLAIVVGDAVKALATLPEPVKEAALWTGIFAAALLATNGALWIASKIIAPITLLWRGLSVAIGLAAAAQTWFATALAAAEAEFAVPAAAIAALIALMVTLAALSVALFNPKWFQNIKQWGKDAWDSIKNVGKEAQARMDEIINSIKDIGKQPVKGFSVDTEAFKKAMEEADQALKQAESKLHKFGRDAIGALIPLFEEQMAKVDKLNIGAGQKEQVYAKYRLVLYKEVNAEIIKMAEAANDEVDKRNKETARLTREVGIAFAEVLPDETFSGQRRLAAARRRAFDEEIAYEQSIEAKKIEKQTSTAEVSAQLAALFEGKSAKDLERQLIEIRGTGARQLEALRAEYREKGNKSDLESMKKLNEIQLAEEKELREQILELDLAMIQRRVTLEKSYHEAIREPADLTLRGRIESVQEISEIEFKGIKETRDARIQSNNDALARAGEIYADYSDTIRDLTKKTAHENQMIWLEADVSMQQNRLELWKRTDALIVEEQQHIFDQAKGFFGDFFDAVMDRSKSVWESIGNLFKKTIMSTLRDIVSSRLAGAFMGALGFGQPSFPSITQPGRPFFPSLTGAPRPELSVPNPESKVLYEGIDQANQAQVAAAGQIYTAGQVIQNSALALHSSAGDLAIAAGDLHAVAGQLASASVAGGSAVTGMGGGAGAAIQAVGGGIPPSTTTGFSGAPGLAGLGQISPLAQAVSGGPATAALPASWGGWMSSGAGGALMPQYLPPPPMLSPQGSAALPASWGGWIGSGAGGVLMGGMPQVGVGPSATIGGAPGGGGIGALGSLGSFAGMSQGLRGMLPAFGLTTGLGLFTSGLQRRGVFGGAQSIAGGMLAGYAGAGMLAGIPGIAVATGPLGAMFGGGLALAALGLQHGGFSGLAMSTLGGALSGAALGTMIMPGVGTLIGLVAGAAAGGIAGLARILGGSFDQQLRDAIKRVYSIDISNKGVRDQIAAIIKSKYGGSISLGVYSADVQEIIRLYRLSQGAGTAGLPRPEYPATFAQSAVGGLQLQPVYSGGQLVQSPYSGMTTAQYGNLGYIGAHPSSLPPLQLQLDPQQANDLMTGRVVTIIQNNPGVVAQANLNAAATGYSRTSQSQALLEPLTVSR